MYQSVKLNRFRTRKILSLFGFILVDKLEKSISDFVWTGKWFKFVEITEQLVKERYEDFDSGWTYQTYWTKWKGYYKFIKLNNNAK